MTTIEKTQDILTNYGLDFTLTKKQLTYEQHGEFFDTPFYGILNEKSGEVLTTVKKDYRIAQNEDFVELVLRGIEAFDTEVSVNTAGSINGGRKVYIQLNVSGDSVIGKDTIKRYITIINSNDKTLKLSVGIGEKVMSCLNQTYSFYKAGQSKIAHSSSLKVKMAEIPFLIENALDNIYATNSLYTSLFDTPCTDKHVKEMVETLVPLNSVEKEGDMSTRKLNLLTGLQDSIKHEISDKGNNLWGLYNGVTYWTNHKRSVPKRNNGKIESLMIGSGYNINKKALSLVESMI